MKRQPMEREKTVENQVSLFYLEYIKNPPSLYIYVCVYNI